MRVLGLTTEGDSGAAIVEDGRILAAVNEERLCRMKLVEGFPRGSIPRVLELTGTRPEELDAVLIASTQDMFVDELHPFEGWFQHWNHTGSLGGRIKCAAGKMSRLRKHLPFLEAGYYALMTPSFMHRRRALRRILRQEFGIRASVRFVDHHLAHLASAYFTSGFRDALVVSMDGGGDGRSTLVHAVRDGRFEYLHETSAFDSLGNYYAYVTHLCGFQAMKHEGKITGLAAHGTPLYVEQLRGLVNESRGTIRNHAGVVFGEAILELDRRLPRGWRREDLAASIQRHFEEVVCRYVAFWAGRAGLRDLALAGGVFANVRVNQEVQALPRVERVFVHPHMTDGGLGGGAALAACIEGVLPRTMPRTTEPLPDVYLGDELREAEIAAALGSAALAPECLSQSLEEEVAELLAAGHVVARASGRMEFGPRALGNRSILYQPADPAVNDWLNRKLRRTEFMPFAPSVLAEAREQCFSDTAGAEHAAEFMTITFACTRWMRRHLPGVVHLDGTARPQLVRRDVNPGFHRILAGFQRRTGLPGIINTSFNMHEEPIVSSASECVRAFLDGNLDYLAIGGHLVKHPRLGRRERPLRAVAGRTAA